MAVLDLDLALRFGVALGLGFVLGLERERSRPGEEHFAGVRTFALIALLGGLAAYVQMQFGLEWLAVAVFVGLAALALVSHAITAERGDVGITTEVTVLITFLLGGLCVWGQVSLAAAIAVASLLLLSLKDWLHALAQRIEAEDVHATLEFAVITVIVLPLLPNQSYGPPPLAVINPYKIWLMVVLISGLNFTSYILVKVLGQEHGIGLTGVLGGLASSTAVTLGFSQRSRQEPNLSAAFVFGILLAWTVMFFRLLAAVAVVNLGLAQRLGVGLGVMAIVSLGICVFLWRRHRTTETGTVKAGHNPFELGEAIKFGLAFGVVTFVAKAAEEYLGSAGLYLAGALAGLTDVDAISLSMANLALTSPASEGVAARTILIAVLSNTLVKSGMTVSLGAPQLRNRMLPLAGLVLAAGGAAVFLIG
jgi:uncharacterized membrane protein (DUF4010 family)